MMDGEGHARSCESEKAVMKRIPIAMLLLAAAAAASLAVALPLLAAFSKPGLDLKSGADGATG
jgi:hypothetical protein